MKVSYLFDLFDLHNCLLVTGEAYIDLNMTLTQSTICQRKRNNSSNKTVLLRERKRHTARRVASPWGTPPPPPVLTWLGGKYLGGGIGTLGYPSPILTWSGGRYLGWGVGTLGYPFPYPDLDGGYVPWVPPTPSPSWPLGGRYLGQGV